MKASPEAILEALSEIKDPEIPVISITELGIVKGAHFEGPKVVVEITPTYSGCPAMKLIEEQILTLLHHKGYEEVSVKLVYAPPWTTDWITESGKSKLKAYGIAPPSTVEESPLIQLGKKKESIIQCPFCNSKETECRSQFGPTACKALYFCKDCNQPFEHFKAF